MLPTRASVRLRAFAALVLLPCLAGRPAAGQSPAAPASIVDLYRETAPAVVRVKVAIEELDENGKPRTSLQILSGFFITREGRVLTNSAAQASRVWIEKDGLSYLAENIGSDPRTNIGLLQVVKLPEKFGIIPLPASDEPLPVGMEVVAVTSPLEFDPSPAAGLITGYESEFSSYHFPVTYLRINIPGYPGEGGSPVLDRQGRLVGIAVASLPEVRASYVVPARALARIVEDLAAHGRVLYGALPVEFSEGPDAQNVSRQVFIASVVPGSSSARAGLRAGDIVRRLGSATVHRINDVRDAIFYARVGQFVVMEIEREGRRMEFALQVEARPDAAPPAAPPAVSPAPGSTFPPLAPPAGAAG